MPVSQALALFVKIVRKILNRLMDIQKVAISAQIPEPSSTVLATLPAQPDQGENITASLDKELEAAGKEVTSSLKERQRQMLDSLDLKKLGHCSSSHMTTYHLIQFLFYLDMRSMMPVPIGV